MQNDERRTQKRQTRQPTVAKDLCELLARLDDLASLTNPAICRGQSDASWRLQPSLDRNVKPQVAYVERLREERRLVERFRCRAKHLLGRLEASFVLREDQADGLILPMTVMQHYGAPTRLLDWTKSPFVAAFFAAIDYPDEDGAVWWYRRLPLDKATRCRQVKLQLIRHCSDDIELKHVFREDSSAELICPVYLKFAFARAEAQQGLFTIAGRLGLFHEDLLSKLVGNAHFGKLVIRSRLKQELLHALHARGVTASNLQHVGADRLGFAMSQERARGTL